MILRGLIPEMDIDLEKVKWMWGWYNMVAGVEGTGEVSIYFHLQKWQL